MLEPAARLKVISRVKTLVVKYHFNVANIDYADWSRAVDEQIPTLLKAGDNVFEEGVRSLLSQLNPAIRIFTAPILIRPCHSTPLALPYVQ